MERQLRIGETMTLLRRHVRGALSTSISSGTIYNASPDLDEIRIISSCDKHGKVWHQSLLVCRFAIYAVESNRNMVVRPTYGASPAQI